MYFVTEAGYVRVPVLNRVEVEYVQVQLRYRADGPGGPFPQGEGQEDRARHADRSADRAPAPAGTPAQHQGRGAQGGVRVHGDPRAVPQEDQPARAQGDQRLLRR